MWYDIKAKQRPKWYQFRTHLSNFFLKIAKNIRPDNPDVYAFYAKLLTEQMITGGAVEIKLNDHFVDVTNKEDV